AARLVACDLPPGWQLVLDERMATGAPEPTGERRYFRSERIPTSVVNDRNEDVTALVREADRRAARVGELDRRFIGRLAHEHVLELSFDRPIDDAAGAPMLVVDGWVEYPYSQTMFAAWQAGAGFDPPTLEARGEDGRWVVLLDRFGYPAGMPRRMSVPLPKLPPETTALRLRTNLEIYWDRLSIAFAEPCPEARTVAMPIRRAELRRAGFALRTTGPQRLPHYDYARRRPFWDSRYQEGLYTEYGPVDPLVEQLDDALAIFGPGEEIHLEFADVAATLPKGWTRRFVLELDGWCKDMDLYTRDGETVGPIPSSSGNPDAAALNGRYNRRYQVGE
ncbi:MAG: hypothetical protein ACYTGC_15220, partial [Planctomycetota bacterium]